MKIINIIEIKKEYAIIHIDSPKHGHFKILIDKEDIDKCQQYTWSIQMIRPGKKKNFVTYYATNNKKGLLHRFLTNANKGKTVDHINGNTFDNRKCNLRLCTLEENSMNKPTYITNTSGHKGVLWYYYNNYNKWMAYICINSKRITIGYYDTFDEAVKAREKAEDEYFKEYRRIE